MNEDRIQAFLDNRGPRKSAQQLEEKRILKAYIERWYSPSLNKICIVLGIIKWFGTEQISIDSATLYLSFAIDAGSLKATSNIYTVITYS